jgi:hypothetical protein
VRVFIQTWSKEFATVVALEWAMAQDMLNPLIFPSQKLSTDGTEEALGGSMLLSFVFVQQQERSEALITLRALKLLVKVRVGGSVEISLFCKSTYHQKESEHINYFVIIPQR